MPRTGRPTKLTPELQEQIVLGIKVGLNYKDACIRVGVCEGVFYRWREWGLQRKTGIFCDFQEAVEKAVAERQAALLQVIWDHAKGKIELVCRDCGWVDKFKASTKNCPECGGENLLLKRLAGQWYPAAWLLERGYTEQWGRHKLEITGPGGGPIEVTHEMVQQAGRVLTIARKQGVKGLLTDGLATEPIEGGDGQE